MDVGITIITRSWLIWLGATGALLAVFWLAVLDARTVVEGSVPSNHTALHAPILWSLRNAFLVIALGALWRLRRPLSTPWLWAVGGALAMLVCGVAGDLLGAFVRIDWSIAPSGGLGDLDSVERRLLRLATMAAYAVPMLVLLAAAERKSAQSEPLAGVGAQIATLLVRWEPVLFAVGATTLATILLASAFINREFTWLLPIGADTTLAGCAAAAIRARWRSDRVAFAGWLSVCVSMGVGLLMGSYSFGGPFTAPAFIGDYDALPRMLLRDGHVIVTSVGIIGIAAAVARRPYKVTP